MTVASIDTLMGQGSVQTTGKNTDLAITGEGFFTMKQGERTFYTRNGNFMIDRDGGFVNANGLKVQGWNAVTLQNGDRIINPSAPLEDIKIPLMEKLEARETTMVRVKSNLDMNTVVLGPNPTQDDMIKNTHSTSIDVVDPYGNKRRMVMNFQKMGVNQWKVTATIDGIPDNTVKVNIGAVKQDTNNQILMNFNTNGTIASITEGAGATPGTANNGQLVAGVTYTLPDGTVRNFNVDLGQAGQVRDAVTQFSSPTTTRAYFQDGYEMSYLEGFKIDDSGTITGSYSNGERRILGQIAITEFVNPMGLTKEGETMFTESNNSGLPNSGAAGTQGRGKVYAGALEMSNVDLSETFTDMIVTERGFQANSRVITTSDDMLREVLGLKR
jgi:flagellar hook protein FlgE